LIWTPESLGLRPLTKPPPALFISYTPTSAGL
jgi:hypothetical protein